jgi:hypothetical protein
MSAAVTGRYLSNVSFAPLRVMVGMIGAPKHASRTESARIEKAPQRA